MMYYLDVSQKDWFAQERICKDMDIKATTSHAKAVTTSLAWAVLLKIISKPWYIFRILPAYVDYCDFRLYLVLLEEEADKVRTEENAELVEHILQRIGEHLVRESRKDWSELCGLATQKLIHLQYHDELKARTFRTLETTIKSADDTDDA